MLIADTHYHLYPQYNQGTALKTAIKNILAVEKIAFGKPTGAQIGLFYAATPHQLPFPELKSGTLLESNGLELLEAGEIFITARSREHERKVTLFAAQQIKTSENLEVLATGCHETPEKPLALKDTIAWVKNRGSVPVLLWGCGKWTLKRAKLVEAALKEENPDSLIIGDSGLRSRSLPESRLITLCRMRGFRFLAGTDPLPLEGDEIFAGRFLTAFEGDFEPASPKESINALLRGPWTRIGRRNHLFEAVGRVYRMTAQRLLKKG